MHSAGLCNVLVTNGTINERPMEELLPFIDAVNIDVKAFSAEQYKKLGGDFATVLATVKKSATVCHVEITSLIVPGQNDSVQDVSGLAKWLSEISAEIPLHITRFFPRYRMLDCEPANVNTMKALAEAARKKLSHVYNHL
jgi:pyruvate formate lyase activating enzyme